MTSRRANAGVRPGESLAAGRTPIDSLLTDRSHVHDERNHHAKGVGESTDSMRTRAVGPGTSRQIALNLRRDREIFPGSALRALDDLGLDRSTMLAEPESPLEWDRRIA